MFANRFEKYKIPQLTDGVKLPDFKIDREVLKEMDLSADTSDYQFLLALCLAGLENKKINSDNPKYKEYRARMKMELDTFKDLGFCSYVLITWDIVNYCRKNDIPTGVGRGSAAGSLVLYLIGVTDVDSLKYNLYFERFLSKTRAKFKEIKGVRYYEGDLLMDVDLDISFSHRHLLIEWLNKKYEGRIAKLPTISTYTTKVLIKEVLKSYLEFSEERANEISETIPVHFGKPNSIKKSIEESPAFAKFASENPKVIDICKKLYHLNKHFGVHASAWIISSEPLNEVFPLMLTKEKELATVYTMDDALNMAIKIDVLGLRCATLIDKVCKTVGIKSQDINLDDPIIYDNLQNLRTPHGCFQIEADCNYKVLRQIKPKSLSHLAAVVALARPGTLQFVEVFAKYVETGEFQSAHSFFDEILKDTAGIPIYQESLMRMANKVGFTLDEAEILRRIVGKKKTQEMPIWESKIKQKVDENKLDPKVGEILWNLMDASKDYSFNAAHALSYAAMSAMTVYLKFKYPKEFFLCLLELSKDEQNTTEEIEKIQQELRYFDVKLLSPDIIKSHMNFSIEGDDLRFGLGYIKGVSEKTLDKIRHFRNNYSNKFEIFMAANEAGLNIGILSALIQAGCLDGYIKGTRSKAVLEAQTWSILTKKEKERAIAVAPDFNFDLLRIMRNFITPDVNSGKRFIKESREATIRKKQDKYKVIYERNSKHEDLACYFYEKKLIGFSYSKKLSEILRGYYPDIMDLCDIIDSIEGEYVDGCGEIIEVKYGTSKNAKKTKYVKIKLSDTTGVYYVMMFNDKIETSELINEGKFAKGQIVAFNGQKKADVVFCNKIINQEVKIITKLAELKEEIEEEKKK
jgi:DNA-directed DNA polymerase III PolC